MGLKEVQDYATKLKKVEKMKEIREQVYFLFCTSGTGSCFSTDTTERKSGENVLESETAVSKSMGTFGSVSVFRERNYVQCLLLSC